MPAGTSKHDLDAVAASNQSLAQAYDQVKSAPPPAAPRTAGTRLLAAPRAATLQAESIADGTLVDVGDLFNWLATGVDSLVQIFEDIANDVWYVIVSIGDAVYHAVLDCVEAVVAAATWVYNAIKVAVEDVIKFLEFLFGWQDILVTHRVLKNVFLCLGQSTIDGVESAKAQVVTLCGQLQSPDRQLGRYPGLPPDRGDHRRRQSARERAEQCSRQPRRAPFPGQRRLELELAVARTAPPRRS